MNAFVKVLPEAAGAEYLELDGPMLKPDQVLIEVKAASICGADIHLYDWAENLVEKYKPKLPLIMGHQFSGIIVDVGSEVKQWKVGARVTAFPILYCGQCSFCRSGEQNICDHGSMLGLETNGCFAEYVAVRASNVHRLDDAVPFDLGALSGLACIGLHAMERARLNGSRNVAVVGCGPLGLMIATLAKHSGADHLFITGLESERRGLDIGTQIGAVSIEVDTEDARELILSHTNGLGADIVFETGRTPEGVIQSFEIVRKGGRVNIVGQECMDVRVEPAEVSIRELELIGTMAYTSKNWRRVSETLLETEEDLRRLITHQFPLEKAEEGIRLMKNHEALKVILQP
jgi:threonine dehydrogenase-like Zn-dependent dehydrogenase